MLIHSSTYMIQFILVDFIHRVKYYWIGVENSSFNNSGLSKRISNPIEFSQKSADENTN